MKNTYALILLMLIPAASMATGNHNKAMGGSASAYGGDSSAYGGNAQQSQLQTQVQEQIQVQGQGQLQGQNATSSATNHGVGQNVNIVNPRPHKNTPGMFMGAAMGTAPCLVPFGGQGAGAGFGFGFSSSLKDENCMINQSAQVAMQVSSPQSAMEIFCQGKYAKETTQCIGLQIQIERERNALINELNTLRGGSSSTRTVSMIDRPSVNPPVVRSNSDARNWGASYRSY